MRAGHENLNIKLCRVGLPLPHVQSASALLTRPSQTWERLLSRKDLFPFLLTSAVKLLRTAAFFLRSGKSHGDLLLVLYTRLPGLRIPGGTYVKHQYAIFTYDPLSQKCSQLCLQLLAGGSSQSFWEAVSRVIILFGSNKMPFFLLDLITKCSSTFDWRNWGDCQTPPPEDTWRPPQTRAWYKHGSLEHYPLLCIPSVLS